MADINQEILIKLGGEFKKNPLNADSTKEQVQKRVDALCGFVSHKISGNLPFTMEQINYVGGKMKEESLSASDIADLNTWTAIARKKLEEVMKNIPPAV